MERYRTKQNALNLDFLTRNMSQSRQSASEDLMSPRAQITFTSSALSHQLFFFVLSQTRVSIKFWFPLFPVKDSTVESTGF